MDGSDCVEVWAERSEAFGFDGRLVHVGVIEVGNLAGIGTRSAIGLGCFFNQASDTLAGQVVGVVEVEAVWINVPAIRRNFGALDPVAIRVAVEIVTGLDRAVHVCDHNAVGLRRGHGLRIGGKRREGEDGASRGVPRQDSKCESHGNAQKLLWLRSPTSWDWTESTKGSTARRLVGIRQHWHSPSIADE